VFIPKLTIGFLGSLFFLCATAWGQGQASAELPAAPQPPARSEVYRAFDPDAIHQFRPDREVVHRMVDGLVLAVTHQSSVAAAWGSLVRPADKVGIKVSAIGAPLFATHPAVVDAIVEGLKQAGVPSQNIIVWDRDAEALQRAGFKLHGPNYRLAWAEQNYDPKAVITSPTVGKLVYGDLFFVGKPTWTYELGLKSKNPFNLKENNISGDSHVTKVLTRTVTKVIDVPILSDHSSCGLAGALYNMTVQNVDNWRRLVQEPGKGDPEIPEMYSDKMISGKVVLHLMDALVALYAGGPYGDANYAIQYGTLLASKDPVALDAIALKKIDQWRKDVQLNPASQDATYVNSAASYGLGNSDLKQINDIPIGN
jgi:uncharacterized protein (DUF362 family)